MNAASFFRILAKLPVLIFEISVKVILDGIVNRCRETRAQLEAQTTPKTIVFGLGKVRRASGRLSILK